MLLIMPCLLPATVFAADTFAVVDLRCEDLVNPLGVDVQPPRLSWRMQADYNGAAQTAYQVLCATSPELLREGAADLWDSGRTETDQSRYVAYGGKKLERGVPCHWTVRIWNEKREASAWGSPGLWTVFDMTSASDPSSPSSAAASWKAKWITQNYKGNAVPWLRRSFQLESAPAKAYIYVNALGYFQLFINGKRVGDAEFAPHVGQYDKRTFCLTYDVAKYLGKGKNAIGIWMGSAWNRGGAGVKSSPSVRAQLEIVDAGGKTTAILTDENWRAKPSSMSYTGEWKWGNFGGEVHDGRLDEPDWANPDYDDSAWSPAAPATVSTSVVSAEMLQPSRVIETIAPVKVTKVGKASAPSKNPAAANTTSWLVDMGKAMTGTFEISFPSAPKGHEVSMVFGDCMRKGQLNSYKQASTYICRGSGTEQFRNRFNYASCRFIQIDNAPEGELKPSDIKGFLITTDLPKASTFRCSDETLNKIYGMMEHTLRCLMLGGYQVDCHSRERQGYGGDGHSSLDTTLCLLRADAFYRKWTRDWADQQTADGGLTYTSPSSGHGGGPFWCGFLTAATLKHYYHNGDLAMVQRNYPAIKKWFELAQSKSVDNLQQKFCGGWYLGDWASPAGDDRSGLKDGDVFIQAYMCYALEQAASLAEALGKTEDAKTFRGWAAARRAAAHRKQYDSQGKKYGSGRQMTYILPLAGGVVPEELRDQVFAGYEKTLKDTDKGHLETGLSGTYMAVQYLQKIGRDDLIYLFASKKTQPSWGYMIEQGATATWEHWNGGQSQIHNCFNNIGSWFIEGLAGIRPDPAQPGFKSAIIKPAVLKELSHVEGSHDTAYGTIQSNWKRDGDTVTMTVRIPANTTATIYVPATDVKSVTVNGQPASAAPHVKYLKTEGGRVLLQVESGSHEIVCR